MGTGTTLDYSDRTDIGRRRANNQDSKGVLAPWSREQFRRRGWLFVVADGMGAHAAGEMASAIAAEQVPLLYEKLAAKSPPLALRESIEQANAEIHAKGESSPDLKGMGTTCTALALVPRGALVGHVGDSRAYRVRGPTIEQLSRDHSLVWELRDMHGGDEQRADLAPRNIITRSMGPHAQVKVDIEGPFPVEAGDTFVLCSDGLSGQVADEEIGLLAGTLPPQQATAALVGLALVRGAPDNVTVIVARAGEREATRKGDDEPWPLEQGELSPGPRPLPWRRLVAAAAALFGALLLNPRSNLFLPDGPIERALGPDLSQAVSLVACGGFLLAFIGLLLAASLGFLLPATADVRLLRRGDRLGGGPYRSYACAASAPLVEGIVASVEAAIEGLTGPARSKAEAAVHDARRAAAAGDFTSAIGAAAAAIATYAAVVEATRTGDTIRRSGPETANDGPNRPAWES